MSYSIDNLSARVYWHKRPLIARDAFNLMIGYLRQLQELSPIFAQYYVPDASYKRHVPIAPDFANFDEAVAAVHYRDVTYTNPDPANKSFTMVCTGWTGFGTAFATVPNDRQAGAWVTITCGTSDPETTRPDCVDIKVSPGLESPELLRTLLDHMVLFWRPTKGTVTRATMYKAVPQPVGDVRVGWLTYLSNPTAASVLPETISRYNLADGLVVQAAERPGFADDPDYVSSVRGVRDMLAPHGFLHDPSETATISM